MTIKYKHEQRKINEPKITCNKQYDKKTKLTSNLNLTQRPFHNLQKK